MNIGRESFGAMIASLRTLYEQSDELHKPAIERHIDELCTVFAACSKYFKPNTFRHQCGLDVAPDTVPPRRGPPRVLSDVERAEREDAYNRYTQGKGPRPRY